MIKVSKAFFSTRWMHNSKQMKKKVKTSPDFAKTLHFLRNQVVLFYNIFMH